MVADTQTDPAALTSQALHGFIHLTALKIQALHFFCSGQSVNCGNYVHGWCEGYACTDRLYSLCNAFNDNVHHLTGKRTQCLLCAINSGHTHAQTNYSSPLVICTASARAKPGCNLTDICMAGQQAYQH